MDITIISKEGTRQIPGIKRIGKKIQKQLRAYDDYEVISIRMVMEKSVSLRQFHEFEGLKPKHVKAIILHVRKPKTVK